MRKTQQKIRIQTPIPGPKSRKLCLQERRHLAPGLQRFAQMAGIAVKTGQASTVTDVDGNVYLDLIGGIGVNGLGHNHPRYLAALHKQLDSISVGSFTSEPRVALLKRLARHLPTSTAYQTQLYSSGAEAVESALRLAKSFTGKFEFVSFWGGFHGKTMGALSLMGSGFKEKLGPFIPGSHVAPYADCYRCPLKLKYPSCGIACADLVRKQIKANSSGAVAAFIIEPMQGSAGNVIPPPEFLPAIQSIARELNALFITDEMITGFGRTGRYWGTEHSKVQPDIVTIGKQFGGGMPISGVIARADIAKAKPWSNPSGSSSSYGGSPLASAAAAAALRIIDEEYLVENSKRMGAYFLKQLLPFEERYPFVGEVRGAGLFLAIELVKDRSTREPLAESVTHRIFTDCLKRGLLTMAYDARFRLQPAMTIDRETIDEAASILTQVFDQLSESGSWK